MISFLVTSIFAFVVYLLLTAGSGTVLLLWSVQELWAGAFLGLVTGAVARKFFCNQRQGAPLNPLRWIMALTLANSKMVP